MTVNKAVIMALDKKLSTLQKILEMYKKEATDEESFNLILDVYCDARAIETKLLLMLGKHL
jgi:hypothetical protein